LSFSGASQDFTTPTEYEIGPVRVVGAVISIIKQLKLLPDCVKVKE
jgi:hypothetical protein